MKSLTGSGHAGGLEAPALRSSVLSHKQPDNGEGRKRKAEGSKHLGLPPSAFCLPPSSFKTGPGLRQPQPLGRDLVLIKAARKRGFQARYSLS